jgi:RNase H-fold protein (predicted Holliday junction resolvase)
VSDILIFGVDAEYFIETVIGILIPLWIFVILRYLGFEFYTDPLSQTNEKTQEITIFTDDMSKNKEFLSWREEFIKELAKNNVKNVYFHSGEFNPVFQQSAKMLLKNGINVTVVAGPLDKDPTERQKTLSKLSENFLNYRDKFKIFIENERQEDHYVILGPHLLIEKRHKTGDNKRVLKLIRNAYPQLLEHAEEKINELKKNSIQLKLENSIQQNIENNFLDLNKVSGEYNEH